MRRSFSLAMILETEDERLALSLSTIKKDDISAFSNLRNIPFHGYVGLKKTEIYPFFQKNSETLISKVVILQMVIVRYNFGSEFCNLNCLQIISYHPLFSKSRISFGLKTPPFYYFKDIQTSLIPTPYFVGLEHRCVPKILESERAGVERHQQDTNYSKIIDRGLYKRQHCSLPSHHP